MDIIAGIATATGEAGISIIRISGSGSIELLKDIFVRHNGLSITSKCYGRINFGRIVWQGELVDEVLVSIMKAPKSYTKEDVVEINCHGGYISSKRVLELLIKLGVRMAEPGEFTKRAFLNGRIDLSQAEAIMDLISANSVQGHDVALNNLLGKVSGVIVAERNRLLSTIAAMEACIDFPEDDLEEITAREVNSACLSCIDRVEELIRSADDGRLIKDGILTAIVGKPNVGKSSLLNLLLKEQRAIVTSVPGTTRDVIEDYVMLKGVTLRLMDTAGIRHTDDEVEQIGVKRSLEALNRADLILFMLDSSRELMDEDVNIWNSIGDKRCIVIVNKTDLPAKLDLGFLGGVEPLFISIEGGEGLLELEQKILEISFDPSLRSKDSAIITSARHKSILYRVREYLKQSIDSIALNMPLDCVALDIKEAYFALGEIIGESITEDIVDKIFRDFCVGK